MGVFFTFFRYYILPSIAIEMIIKKGKALHVQRLPFFLYTCLL